MSKQFIGRAFEFNALQREYKKKQASLIVIYGRRRIGKTELALKHLEKYGGIYFLADRRGYRENMKSFQKTVSKELNMPIFQKAEFENWYDMMEEYVKNMKERTLIIDEFPYLMNEGLDSEFQKIWDMILSKTDIVLFLIGSSISMMEKSVLNYGAPLYGRRTMQLKLEKLSFSESRGFFRDLTLEEFIKIYAFLDGIPMYLSLFKPELSFEENMIENYLRKDAFLFAEAEFLLKEEFREPSKYFLILWAISSGKRGFGELSSITGLDKSTISQYLSHLIEIGVIKHDLPALSDKNRMKRYRISDNYLSSWFKYIYNNKGLIEQGRTHEVLDYINKSFSSYADLIFEDLIRDIIIKSWGNAGSWWNRKGDEIDIVAYNEKNNEVLFGEVKWSNKPASPSIIEDLKQKAKLVTWNNYNRKESFVIVSKSGFTGQCLKIMKNEKVIYWDMKKIEEILNSWNKT